MFVLCSYHGSKHDDAVGELKRQGKNGLHIRCTGCGYTVIAWWKTMGVPDDRDVDYVIGKLRCDRCKTRPGALDVRPYLQGNEAPAWYGGRGKRAAVTPAPA